MNLQQYLQERIFNATHFLLLTQEFSPFFFFFFLLFLFFSFGFFENAIKIYEENMSLSQHINAADNL